MISALPPEPWLSFFGDLNEAMNEVVSLHCLGGFVVSQLYGTVRPTADIDYLALIPVYFQKRLTELGGMGSPLHKAHKVYLDPVTVVTCPEDYESRLVPLFTGTWNRIELYALEAHDLALSKLERNLDRDRGDVGYLAKAGYLNPETLNARYHGEMRPHLSRTEWHDQTLKLWIESFWPAH